MFLYGYRAIFAICQLVGRSRVTLGFQMPVKYCRPTPGHLIFIMQVFRHLRLLILCAVIPTGKQPFFRG